ncbi:MAG: bifunctional 5,10-methylenetetrahydrofolate dehydrogenase/5,10-methenyltetrahydrofolate cyclohydrolase [Candidatus Eremiobacteraeota bacterium]|nr:bifunctional 5,10-methylenetetrahydrofolate dehydrogenase/5,10-methenyltetrahydrofolate cyclohydrolase [Candidatus Eremiobacteraeota bacterium]
MREKDLNGKELAKKIRNQLTSEITKFKEETQITPKLGIVYMGEDLSAAAYIRSKRKRCKKVGMETELFHFSATISLKNLRKELKILNEEESIHGIILELPLPPHIPFIEAVASVDPNKDVDGLHPANLGWLFAGNPFFIPNTPWAVMTLLKEYKIPLRGKEVVIVGRSLSVGKPLIPLMLAENATVTTCHTKTKDLKFHTSNADILVASAGRAKLITGDMIKEGAVVVDVGINVTDDGIVGDVDYEQAYPRASRITPVPGGVGPITVSMIIRNTLVASVIQAEAKGLNSKVVPIGHAHHSGYLK